MEAFVGQILTFAGTYVPQGWLACDGSMQSISAYETLFALIGTTYGGDGVNTFGLPNLSARIALHQGVAASGSVYVLGTQGGTASVTLKQDNLPLHGHALNVTSSPTTASPGAQQLPADQAGNASPAAYAMSTTANLTAMGSSSIGPMGGSQPHANVQPSLAVTYGICVSGVYPQFN